MKIHPLLLKQESEERIGPIAWKLEYAHSQPTKKIYHFFPFLQSALSAACWHQFFCNLRITGAVRLPLPLCFPLLLSLAQL